MAVRDVIFAGILIFALATGMFLLNYTSNQIIDKTSNNSIISNNTMAKAAVEGGTAVTNKMDYMMFGVFIGLALAMIITSWFISGYPIFMIFYFMIVIIGVVVSAIFSNAWETMSSKAIFASTLANMPITNHLLLYLPMYLAVLGFIGIVVMFGKPYFAGYQGGEL